MFQAAGFGMWTTNENVTSSGKDFDGYFWGLRIVCGGFLVWTGSNNCDLTRRQ
jgi:hypothetical protein